MNLDHPNFGQQYRLSRLAVRLRTFTISELMRLTGIIDDTVYGFVSKLIRAPQEYLQWEELPRSTRGRPVKRYTLTEAGVDYLLERNARLAAILDGGVDLSTATADETADHERSLARMKEAGDPAHETRMAALYREVVLKDKVPDSGGLISIGKTAPPATKKVATAQEWRVGAAAYVKE